MNGVAGVVIDEFVVIERQVWLKLRLVEVHIVVCIVVKKFGKDSENYTKKPSAKPGNRMPRVKL